MGKRDDAPQTVGQALDYGWEWLGVQCQYCRGNRGRVDLRQRKREEKLAHVAAKCWCAKCGKHLGDYLAFELGLVIRTVHTKPIHFSGNDAFKLGMG